MSKKDEPIEVEGVVKDDVPPKKIDPKSMALKSLAGYTGGVILANAMPGGLLAQIAYLAGGSVLVASAVEAIDRKTDELAERIGELLSEAVVIDLPRKGDKDEK